MNQQETALSHLGLLCVEGNDAKKLLQGQLTCHLDELVEGGTLLGAHCNPQGRMISFFRIFLSDKKYYLQMPRTSVSLALAALRKYAVFFKVTLSDISDSILQLGFEDDHQTETKDSFKISGNRLMTFNKPLSLKKLSAAKWKQIDIELGIPAIYPETVEKFLPHELNLPKLQAISFNKGCFTGQEIIARMEYRGKLKTHLYKAKVKSPILPQRGQPFFHEKGEAGFIVDFAEIGYNEYALLITANENEINTVNYFLDADKTIILEC